jgi:hypothetical protein
MQLQDVGPEVFLFNKDVVRQVARFRKNWLGLTSHKCSFKAEQLVLSQAEPYVTHRLQLYYSLALFPKPFPSMWERFLCVCFTLISWSSTFNIDFTRTQTQDQLSSITSLWQLQIQLNNRVSKYVKQKLIEWKEEIDNSAIIETSISHFLQ